LMCITIRASTTHQPGEWWIMGPIPGGRREKIPTPGLW